MQFASAGLPVDARAAEEDDRRQQVVHDLHSQHIWIGPSQGVVDSHSSHGGSSHRWQTDRER